MNLSKIKVMHSRYGKKEGHKCATCCNLLKNELRSGKTYYKCKVYGMSCSTSTDWVKSYEACGMYNVEYEPDQRRALNIREKETKINKDILDGQITLMEV